MAMPVFFVLLLIAAVIVLVGLVGLVLLIVGIAKKRTALWVCGLIAMVLAGLVLLVGAPAVLFAFLGTPGAPHQGPRSVVHGRLPSTVEAEPHEGGCSIAREDGRVTVRVEVAEIQVLEPGSGGSRASSQSGGGYARHEIGVGNVEIFVEKHDGRLDMAFSVNGRACGRIRPGDRVVITPDREVLVNGERRLL